jgi:hypothetical protein
MKVSSSSVLYTQRHNRVDYVVPVLLESFYSFLPGHRSLSHDELDVFALETTVIDFLVVVIILFGLLRLDLLALAVLVRMIVPCVITASSFRSSELLGGSGL